MALGTGPSWSQENSGAPADCVERAQSLCSYIGLAEWTENRHAMCHVTRVTRCLFVFGSGIGSNLTWSGHSPATGHRGPNRCSTRPGSAALERLAGRNPVEEGGSFRLRKKGINCWKGRLFSLVLAARPSSCPGYQWLGPHGSLNAGNTPEDGR